MVPADRFLVETDSPYLAPVPFRGKRNEPAFVAQVVEALADGARARRAAQTNFAVGEADGELRARARSACAGVAGAATARSAST